MPKADYSYIVVPMTDIDKWQSGDMAAFEALFRCYEKLVFKTAYLITGSRDRAEDVLQEVFIAVWNSRRTYDPNKGKLTTWLHRITVNQCSKGKTRKEPATVPLEEKEMDAVGTRHSQPDDILVSKLEYDKLLQAMDSLDTKHRSVLVLRYFNDLSYQEIAESLGIPLGTVKSRINQSLQYLRGQVNPGEA